MKIIDGDKFQKEYVKQEQKNNITEIVIGALLIVLGIIGLILHKNLLYTLMKTIYIIKSIKHLLLLR